LKFEGYDFSADFWQIGLCLYQFLTKSHPFEINDRTTNIFEKIVLSDSNPITFPSTLKDEEAKDLISKLLAYNQSDRL
jgi:serine/threonine protein kinase